MDLLTGSMAWSLSFPGSYDLALIAAAVAVYVVLAPFTFLAQRTVYRIEQIRPRIEALRAVSRILIAFLIALSVSACTAEHLYDSAQAWRRNQCYKTPDKAELDRCVSQANTGYESYKHQTQTMRR